MAQEPASSHKLSPTVLCIEDEYFISGLYSRALTQVGYEVTVEADGQKGLELAQTDKYDIILLDLMLPSLSGVDILKILRDPARTPHLHSKIVIITNLEQQPELRASVEKQADGYIVKAEITPRDLVEFLKKFQLSPKT